MVTGGTAARRRLAILGIGRSRRAHYSAVGHLPQCRRCEDA